MKFYEGTPHRERMKAAPLAASPFPITNRCPRIPEEERAWPIDDSAGGCDDQRTLGRLLAADIRKVESRVLGLLEVFL